MAELPPAPSTDRMPAVIRRDPVRTHTQHRHVPGKESGGITQLLQTWTHVTVRRQDCKQALFLKLRWSVESCSHFKHHLFINPPRGTHTHTQTYRHGDRNSADSSVTLQRSTSFPLPFPPNLPLSPLPKSMECFVTQRCISCNIHLKKQARLTLNEFS